MLQFISIFLFFLIYTYARYEEKLKFREDGTFKIVQFTDLHYSDVENDNSITSKNQNQILDAEKPDFIAYTGDLVQGYDYGGKKGFVEAALNICTAPPNDRGIPYGIALGNHDSEGDLTREEIMELDMKKPYSTAKPHPENVTGPSTFYVPIYSPDGSKIEFLLWFFDSMRDECLGAQGGYGCVQPNAVQWYVDESKKYPGVPGVAFYHIPSHEHRTAYYDLDAWGYKWDYFSCPYYNTGLTSAMMKIGNILGVFVGHEHSNDFYTNYHGIQLHYGRKTGYRNYGPAFFTIGAKMIEVTRNGTMKTWVRNQAGNVEEQTPIWLKGSFTVCNHILMHPENQ